MPRLLGVDVPSNKQLWVALQSIYGLGRPTVIKILDELKIDRARHAGTLTVDELTRLSNHIENNFTVEGNLRRQRAQNINRLRDIKCNRGVRHKMGLPVRGQRTRTNARTRKGPRKTVANKKAAPK